MDAPVPLIACALLAAGAILLRGPRLRAASTLGVLVLAPVLLLADIWDTDQLRAVRDHPPAAIAAAVAGALVVVALAWLVHRRPEALPVAAALTIPFRVPIAVGGSTSNLLVPLYLVVAAGALAYAVPRLVGGDGAERPPERRPGALEWLLAIAVVLYAVQASYSDDRDQALQSLVFFYVPFAVLFALLARMTWTRALALRVLGVVSALALVFVAVGFVEYATRHLLLNPKIVAASQAGSAFRVNSLFFDPNMYGRFLAVVMIGLAATLLWTRRARDAGALAAALVMLWAGLVLTLSQTSFAALLLGLLVLAGARWRLRWAIGTGVAALVAGAALVVLSPSAIDVHLDSAKGANTATSGRYELVRGGVDLFRQRPLAGYGSGAFSVAYRRAEHAAGDSVSVSRSHTIPVTVAAEQGVIGLAAYVALLVAAFATLLRGARAEPVRVALAAAFAALVLHTWSYAAFLEDPLTWALLGAGLALARAAADARPRRRRRPAQEPAVPVPA
ncbi:MAG TPA: O-antigen ligase family protein [Baekduia sp.]|nr:O-antigen ligase family protein [Baekduia sp.]